MTSVNNRKRILVADNLHPSGLALFSKKLYNLIVDASLKGEKLEHRIQEFKPHILIVRSTTVSTKHLNASPNLALIIRAGAGTNTINVLEASNKGIFVCNCPGKNAIAVAELTIGHLINLDRRISDGIADLKIRKWNKKKYSKHSFGLHGRTLAVIGCAGNVGCIVARYALAFGMIVRGFDPYLTDSMARAAGIIKCSTVAEACSGAHAVTVHVPLLKSTKYLINRRILSKLRDGAYVINTSRGGIIHETDMLAMIAEKGLRVALDVYEHEPSSSDLVFNDVNNIIKNGSVYGTHHIGASTEQASDAVCKEVFRIANAFCVNGEIFNCINLERSSNSIATHTLTVRHADVVGVLAAVLKALRIENINVQHMKNIIFLGAKSACATLSLDKEPSVECVEEIMGVGGVYSTDISCLKSKL